MDTMNITQAARYLNVTEKTLRKWIKQGKFPSARKVERTWVIAESELAMIAKPGDVPATEDYEALRFEVAELRRRVEELESQGKALPLPTKQRAPTDRKSEALQKEGLPDGLVSWASFADQHGIARSTVQKAIAARRLPIVVGRWRTGKVLVLGALDAPGRSVFYQLYHDNPHFTSCLMCPHETRTSEQESIHTDGS